MPRKRPSPGIDVDLPTETKILVAARRLFEKQGYAATTTRDIAREAGINLALLNYYFRSKQNLFAIIMTEHLQGFMQGLRAGINDPTTTLEEKFIFFADAYTSMLQQRPDAPLFILSELRSDPEHLVKHIGIGPILRDSVLIDQLSEAMAISGVKDVHPVQFFINLISLCTWPYIAKPLVQLASGVDDAAYARMMAQRRTLIPIWMTAMLTPQR